jgi:hypothetical protein
MFKFYIISILEEIKNLKLLIYTYTRTGKGEEINVQ